MSPARDPLFCSTIDSLFTLFQQCQLQPLFSPIDSLAAQHQHSQEEPALITGYQNSLKTYPLSPGRGVRVHTESKNQTIISKKASVHIKAKKIIKPKKCVHI